MITKIVQGLGLAPDSHCILHAWSQLWLPATVWNMRCDYLFAHWIGDWTQAKHQIRLRDLYSNALYATFLKIFHHKILKGKQTQQRLPEVNQLLDLHLCCETNEDKLSKSTSNDNPSLDSSTRTVTICLLCWLVPVFLTEWMPASFNSYRSSVWIMC